MRRTIGYHIVVSGYGLWLPGDDRGHWSEAWDDQVGYIEPRCLHAGDPIRQRMARERMKHPPFRLDDDMIHIVIKTIGECEAQSDWTVAAASIETTHTHLLLTYTERHVDTSIKWIKDRCTKAIHRSTHHDGPVWCKGRWRGFVYDDDTWAGVIRYIERHNIRRGEPASPYPFITRYTP